MLEKTKIFYCKSISYRGSIPYNGSRKFNFNGISYEMRESSSNKQTKHTQKKLIKEAYSIHNNEK